MIFIFKFLGIIVLFLLVLALIFVIVGFSVLRKFFGKKGTGYSSTYTRTSSNPEQKTDSNADEKIGKIYAEKIFDKDEGEYVEFEDIPDNKR